MATNDYHTHPLWVTNSSSTAASTATISTYTDYGQAVAINPYINADINDVVDDRIQKMWNLYGKVSNPLSEVKHAYGYTPDPLQELRDKVKEWLKPAMAQLRMAT